MINKKGQATKVIGTLIALVIAILLLIVVGSWLVKSFGKTQPGKYIGELEDCDRDRVPNFRDKCPCLSTGGVEEERLPGCPLGTTPVESENDIKTCTGYYVSKSDPNSFVPTCEDKKKCVTRCDSIHDGIQELPESAGKGIAGDWDVAVSSLTVYHGTQAVSLVSERLDVDLKGESSLQLDLQPTIKNNGGQAISNDFFVGVYVCSSKNKQECTPSTQISGERGDETWRVGGLEAGGSKDLPKKSFSVGLGDYCGGRTEGGCFVKIVADSKRNLAERDEFDNEKSFYVSLQGKKEPSGQFTKYKAIEIVINDEGSPDPEPKTITKTCDGYIGDGAGFSCGSFDSSCGSGEFPSEQEPFPVENGCLIVVSEEDTTSNNCGYTGAENGVVIDYLTPSIITPLKFPFKDTDGNDASNAMLYTWKSLPSGSLVCHQGFWHLCSDEANFQRVFISNVDFICKGKQWVKE